MLGWPRSLATSKLSRAPLSASSPHMLGASCKQFHPKQSELIYLSIIMISHQVQAPDCLFCAGRPLPPWPCSRYAGLLSLSPDLLILLKVFLDALASLDFKLSVGEWVTYRFTASASTGLSDFFFVICLLTNLQAWNCDNILVSSCNISTTSRKLSSCQQRITTRNQQITRRKQYITTIYSQPKLWVKNPA